MPSTTKIASALRKSSKTFLVSLIINLLRKVSKADKIRALALIDRAPKQLRKTKRRSTPKKAKSKKSKGKKKTKAQIKAQRLRNLKKARAAKKRKSR